MAEIGQSLPYVAISVLLLVITIYIYYNVSSDLGLVSFSMAAIVFAMTLKKIKDDIFEDF